MNGETRERRRELIGKAGYYIQAEMENDEDISIYCIGDRQSSYILQILQVYNEEKYRRKIEGRAESVREMTARHPSVFLRYLEYDWSGDARDFQAELMVKMQYGSSMEQHASEKRLTISDVLQIGIRCAEAMEACRECKIPVRAIDHRMLFWLPDEGWKIGLFLADPSEKPIRPELMPPEWAESGLYDKSSEVYSLGMLLYLLMNEDEMPFLDICQTEDEAEQMRLTSAEPPLPLYGTETLKKAVRKACSAREARYSDVSQFRDMLDYIRRHLPDNWLTSEISGHSYRDEEYMDHFDVESFRGGHELSAGHAEQPADRKAEKTKKPETEQPKEYIKARERMERRTARAEQKKAREEAREEEKRKKQIEKQLRRAQQEEREKNARKNGNKDRKDLLIILAIAAAVILIIAGTIIGVRSSRNNKIYSYIDSKTYGTAMVELRELYETGKNVDKAAETFIQSCLEDGEYKRIPDAVQMLSEEYCRDNKEFFENMIKTMAEDNKEKRASDLLDAMEECGGVWEEYAAELRSGAGEE